MKAQAFLPEEISAEEFQQFLEVNKVNQRDLARLLNRDPVTVWRWANGKAAIDAVIWAATQFAVAHFNRERKTDETDG